MMVLKILSKNEKDKSHIIYTRQTSRMILIKNMKLFLRKPTDSEVILLHDCYFNSSEPDAPKKLYVDLNVHEKAEVFRQFDSEFHLAVIDGEKTIGFVGVYPDDDFLYVGVFYVIAPLYRGKGYFSPMLFALVKYCKEEYSNYKFVRALTRKNNIPSIKGLINASFERNGECLQELDFPVTYEEYLLPI